MDVVIAGGHGKIALHLERLLAGRGDRVRGLIRDPDQAGDLRDAGAEPVVCDLEHASVDEVAAAIDRADAVVFAAGAGPGSGAERKLTMDRDGALTLLEAAQRAGVRRYVMVSAMGAGNPPAGEEVFAVYLRAKAGADEALAASDLDWAIVRPGGLTDDPPTGRVRIGADIPSGRIPRADVAAVLAEVLDRPETAGTTFALTAGDTAVRDAVANL